MLRGVKAFRLSSLQKTQVKTLIRGHWPEGQRQVAIYHFVLGAPPFALMESKRGDGVREIRKMSRGRPGGSHPSINLRNTKLLVDLIDGFQVTSRKFVAYPCGELES